MDNMKGMPLSKELTDQRNAILQGAVNRATNAVKRDKATVDYIVGASQALHLVGHPLASEFMTHLAFTFPGRSPFIESCKLAGIPVPPEGEVKHRAKRGSAELVKDKKSA